ncbi:MAG: SPFH domain-containing protein [Pseudomonadota bacterium]
MEHAPEDDALRRHVEFSGTLLPALLLASALVCLAVAMWSRHHTATAAAAWLGLQALLFLELRYRLAASVTDHHAAGSGAFVPPAFLSSALVLWLLLTSCVGLGYNAPTRPFDGGKSAVAIATLAAFVGLSFALANYFERKSASDLLQAKRLASWCRASIWLTTTALLFSLLLATGIVQTQKAIVQGLMLSSLLPVLEWLVRTLAHEDGRASLVGDVRGIPLLFGRLNPVRSLFAAIERATAVDVRSTWALTCIRRLFAPLAVALALVLWLSSSLVTVGVLQSGVRERFGASVLEEALAAGLHLKAPWPIEEIRQVETARVRSIPLGYVGPMEGASLLWTRAHAQEEYSLLLGDGRDLVTFNASLQYRVLDAWSWRYETQNPEKGLRIAAEQALLSATVSRSLDEVLSDNTTVLAQQIEEAIRQRVKQYGVGAQIMGLSLQGLHPPVSVAEDYQAVVSAQHERQIEVLASLQYEIETVHAAQVAALERLADAKAAAVARVASARGAAKTFRQLQAVHALAPTAFEQHHRLRALEALVRDRPFAVIDERIERDGGVLWFEN